ncbi:3-deoxy-manno-octulosonate cytidylyltransferase [bacterium]|nr:3-deoxy-manno-octulosonate cytidylyltransferase [candidate division CSSED10-310 bacterium]
MTRRRNVVAVIPARYGSTRFPGKPLADLAGKPMIVWTMNQVKKAGTVDAVLVATDDSRIQSAVIEAGGTAVMTPSDLPSGSDRVAFVVKKQPADIVVNVQGDEPLIDPGHIDAAVAALLSDPESAVSTLATPITELKTLQNPNVVKVVLDAFGRAVYFSRAPIPYTANPSPSPQNNTYLRHIGLYAYRSEFLLQYTRNPACWMERVERLEQLRILYLGGKIATAVVSGGGMSVDTPEDLARVRALIDAGGTGSLNPLLSGD